MLRCMLISLLLIAVSCQKGKQEPDTSSVAASVEEQLDAPLDLDKAIIRKPPKIMSVIAPVELEFRIPVIPAHVSGTILDKSPFTFKPEVKGTAKWLSQNLIRFEPSKALVPGTTYEATFKGKVALGSQKNVNDFSFSFKTAEQEIIDFAGDFFPDESGANMVRFNGTITFAQPIDSARVVRDLKCKGPKNAIKLTIARTKDNPARLSIITEPLKRLNKGQVITFTLPDAYTVDRGAWSRELMLPAANVFKVLAHMDVTDPKSTQRTYAFRFSDPIKPNTDLSGFVTIAPQIPYTLSIDGKHLRIQGTFLPGAAYTVKIALGLPSALGTRLEEQYSDGFSFDNIKPEVTWLSEGIFLPPSNNFKLQFKSVNVAKVRIVVTEIFENNIGFFTQNNILHDRRESSYDEYEGYSSSSFSDLERVGSEIYNKELAITTDLNRWVNSELDLAPVLANKRNSAFVVTLRFGSGDLCGQCITDRNDLKDGMLYYEDDNYYSSPCRDGYYYSKGTVSKLLISSDIALTIKDACDGVHIYATNVITARPARSLSLELVSYQNQVLERVSTDVDGHAAFSKKDGFYIRGQNGNGLVLIRTNHPSWELSGFEISGIDEGAGGINSFIYTDRGVHRPGDTVHLSAIIRSNRQAPPPNQPVLLKVYNPKQQVVHEAKTTCGENGHIYFAVPTDISDPTGGWRADIEFAGQTISKQLKIEMVKPNRLKVDIDVPDTLFEGSVRGTLSSRYLFGTPAANLKSRLTLDISGKSLSIPAFDAFTFSHPLRRFERRTATISERVLDGDGRLAINYELPDAANVPELLGGTIRAEVFEKGGGFTSQSKRITVVPYAAYVGVKNVFSWEGAKTGEKYELPIVVSDVRGNAICGHRIKLEWYLNRNYWWWDYDSRNRPDFREMKNTYRVGEYTLISGTKPIKQALDIEDEGQHLIQVTDLETGHSSAFFFWASSWGRTGPARDYERAFLELSNDKNLYYTGDKATISFETPRDGMAIFTIEQGSRILRQEVRPVSAGRSEFTFDITEDCVPNCYAVVSLIQPHGQKDNDLPLRTFGVKPLAVEDFGTRLQLAMSAPEEIKPNEQFTVKISSKAPRIATYTVAVVDEGLLDLTGFDTPDPWGHYFKKLRLAITTRDNFEEILGALLPGIDRFFSIGGDMEEERKKRAGESRVQRFKPVVLFSGPLTVAPGATGTVSMTMPNYVGSVRIMVIGSSQNSYVSLEKTVPVRQPLMVLPTVPRVARPLDRFLVPVSVFAMDSSVTSVSVTLKTSDILKIEGSATKTIAFTRPGEQDLAFSVAVAERIGAARVTVTAKSGSHSASDEIDLPVTSPNPFYIKVTDTTLSNGSVTLIPQKVGIEGTNRARVTFTKIPDIQLHKRYRELVTYPYGCVEQTTSSAFPQLFIGNLIDLTSIGNQEITKNVNAAIDRLSRFQIDAGFAFWPLSHYHRPEFNDWGSSYVGHFLIEAKAAGYHVPEPLYNHWLKSARRLAKTVNRSNHRYQAYRLFLLSLSGNADMGAMNLVRENFSSELDPLSKKLLSAGYYLAGQKDAARGIEKTITTEIKTYRELSGTFGSSLRDRSLMAYLAFRMEDLQGAAKMLRSISKEFKPYGWYSTQETSYTLLALSTVFAKSSMPGGAVSFTVSLPGKKSTKIMLKGYQETIDIDDMWGKEIKITSEGSNPLFVTLYEEGIPVENVIPTAASGMELTRNFYDDDGKPITLGSITQGRPFWVRYRVRSQTQESLKELAISSMFPSGWEIINLRLEGTEPPPWVSKLNASDGTYMDIRDDRVNWFFDLGYQAEANFVVKLNPSFKGTYRLPPVTVEPMYSPDYYARIAGDSVVVK